MYVEVVVLTYQSPEIQTYTYLVPKELEKEIKIGQLVCVPFGRRNPMGVILSITARPSAIIKYIKPVASILLRKPIMLPFQIKLLKWMAEYYHAPMVNCLEAILPQLPHKLSITGTIHSSQSTTSQTVVLLPSINRIPETLAKYPQSKNHAIYHNELKTSEKFAVWQEILSGNIDFIFGTRSAIFTPSSKLSKIIIHDEHEESYKDERSPYFDTLTIAEKLCEISGAKLQIIDPSPKITTYFNHKSDIQIPKTPIKTRIVSMLEEKIAGNRLPLSQLLIDYIKLAAQKRKSVLLFLNKKGRSGHIYCKNCKYSEFIEIQPEACPNCKSADIWFNSNNINSLASLVKKIVPGAKINIIAEGLRLSTSDIQESGISIATAAVFYSQKSSAYKLISKKYDLVAHIASDAILNITDFSSAEKLYAQINNLKRLTKGLLLLQTYNPDSPAIKIAAQGDFSAFFVNEMNQRKALGYPPFVLLVKLSIKGGKGKNLEANAQQLFDNLNRLRTTSHKPQPAILGPYKPLFTKGRPEYNIILKIPVSAYNTEARETALNSASNLLKAIPRSWQIEIEPNSLN